MSRMRNRDLIQSFVLGSSYGKASNLYIHRNQLINYSTPIALWYEGVLFINVKKYSPTTSRNQSLLKYWAGVFGIQYKTYEGDFGHHLAQSLADEGIFSNDIGVYSA